MLDLELQHSLLQLENAQLVAEIRCLKAQISQHKKTSRIWRRKAKRLKFYRESWKRLNSLPEERYSDRIFDQVFDFLRRVIRPFVGSISRDE